MDKAAVIKTVIFIGVVVIFSLLLLRNYQEGHGCKDCITERLLTGKEYDGWLKLAVQCENYTFDEKSSLTCFNSKLPWEFEAINVTQSEIKIPAMQIFNTILMSKSTQAFIVKGEYCMPSFAIVADGSIYSTGGCMG